MKIIVFLCNWAIDFPDYYRVFELVRIWEFISGLNKKAVRKQNITCSELKLSHLYYKTNSQCSLFIIGCWNQFQTSQLKAGGGGAGNNWLAKNWKNCSYWLYERCHIHSFESILQLFVCEALHVFKNLSYYRFCPFAFQCNLCSSHSAAFIYNSSTLATSHILEVS